jgi:hypothetical protein
MSSLLAFNRVYRLEIQSFMLVVFSVCNGGGWGCVESIHMQELYTVYLTRFRAYKIALLPKTKNLGGRGGGLR